MKNYFLLLLIGLLFAIGSKEKPIFAQKAFLQEEKAATETPVKVTESFLGEEQLTTIYVGENLDLSKHEVLALWYNIEEVDTSEVEPIIVNRLTGVSDVQLNSKFLSLAEDNVAIWEIGDTPEDFLKRLTDKLLSANENIAAAKYKLVLLDEDSFRLEDLQLIYNRGYRWDRIVFNFKVDNRVNSLCHSLDGV